MSKIIKKRGFSLLELILVLAIASAVSFMKFQDLKNEEESVQAKAVGEQIKEVGDAVNGYINIHYDKLSTLTSVSSGDGTDPGPRTCSTANDTCTITYQTLSNEGLLPSTFNGKNANNSSYSIVLKRSGTSPNYIINGLVTTNTSWEEGGKIRYDLLGKAMQYAGVDSGMTKVSTTISGYSGNWSESSGSYSNINKTGLLGYRVGYDSAMYSVFLRRDGTLPMTGNLNMGEQSIYNANNITASGTTTTGSLKTTGDAVIAGSASVGNNLSVSGSTTLTGALQVNNTINATGNVTSGGDLSANNWVWAKNGYGDSIGLGGDAANSDYEIRLGSGKPLTIFSPSAASYSKVLEVNGNSVFDQRIATNGLDPNNLPSGWGGGVRTFDVYASGTVATGDSSGNVKAYINASGNLYVSNTAQIDGSATIGGNETINGTTTANGRLTANEYVQMNGVVTEGSSCSSNGVQARLSSGALVSCVNGTWERPTISWQACRTCGGNWPYLIANFTLHGDSGVTFNGYGDSCSGSYTNGVSNSGDYMQLCAKTQPQ